MTALWTSEEIASATGGRATTPFAVSGISIDTRTIAPGELFVALTAARDGHDFVAEALAKGAAGALVSRVPEGVSDEAPLVLVADVLDGLRDMALAARARTRAKVIGVTGSVGKTGTKEMLRTMLAVQGRVHAAEKSFNNHWGVPLTLARMPRESDFAVIEIGMNAPGEIAPLSELARPDAAIVTTVAPVHIENFENLQGIAREKASIVAGLAPGGAAILNRDVETYPILRRRALRQKARVVTFGAGGRPAFRLREARLSDDATLVEARAGGETLLFKIGAPGTHLALNALAALAAVEAVGGDLGRAALALAHWHVPDGRGARWLVGLGDADEDGSILLIDDAYNANPTSVAAALEVLAATTPKDGIGRVRRGRRIAILADMLELGDEAEEMHATLADLPTIERITRIHTAGPLMKALNDALPVDKRGEWRKTAAALSEGVGRLVDGGDVVLVKGSLGSRAGQIVEAIKALGVARRLNEKTDEAG